MNQSNRDLKQSFTGVGQRDIMFDRSAFTTCFTGPVLWRSLMVALLIGTVLTAINQSDIILAGDSPATLKVALTYLVPFLMASYGAGSALTVQAKMPSRASEEER